MIKVRLDKFLKVSRLIKRRTIAKEIAGDGIIEINGRVAKPSSEVKVNDVLDLRLGTHKLTIKVLSTNEVSKKNNASEMYEVINDVVIIWPN